MHIHVTAHGEVNVIGGHRVRARLQNFDLASPKAVIEHLVNTGALTLNRVRKVQWLAEKKAPSTIDGWVEVIAAAHSPAKDVEQYVNITDVEQKAPVYIETSETKAYADEEEHLHEDIAWK